MKPAWWMAIPIFLIGAAMGVDVSSTQMKKLAARDIAAFQEDQSRFERLAALHKEAVLKWQACSARWNEAAGTGTVIYEPQLDAQPEGLVGMLARLGGPESNAMVTKRSVRWIIPFKVEPQVADEIRGARYGWIDKDGKFQGWFTPKQVE